MSSVHIIHKFCTTTDGMSRRSALGAYHHNLAAPLSFIWRPLYHHGLPFYHQLGDLSEECFSNKGMLLRVWSLFVCHKIPFGGLWIHDIQFLNSVKFLLIQHIIISITIYLAQLVVLHADHQAQLLRALLLHLNVAMTIYWWLWIPVCQYFFWLMTM